ncbi:MAG: hypothetical protein PHI97_18265 [Desulfobulbus sp.]|nr:hypothetical protein [Desulfobulbus sp.]
MQKKKLIAKLLLTALLISAPIAVPAFADNIDMLPKKPGHRQKLSPDLFEACQDKAAGDTVNIETPRGDRIEAVCEQKDDQLVARPLSPPPQPSEKE